MVLGTVSDSMRNGKFPFFSAFISIFSKMTVKVVGDKIKTFPFAKL
jgi:hypothetical protein